MRVPTVWSGCTKPCPPIRTEDPTRLPADEITAKREPHPLHWHTGFLVIVGDDFVSYTGDRIVREVSPRALPANGSLVRGWRPVVLRQAQRFGRHLGTQRFRPRVGGFGPLLTLLRSSESGLRGPESVGTDAWRRRSLSTSSPPQGISNTVASLSIEENVENRGAIVQGSQVHSLKFYVLLPNLN
jgi:hypothetical protein